jgi:hypothetical protein
MCSTIAASIAATVMSTAVTMYAQNEAQNAQANATRKAAQYNAQVAENQAAAQESLARNEEAKGIADRERQQRAAARAMGAMRAGMGASGFEMDSGTNLSLLSESAEEHQYDSNVIMSNAAQAAWQRRAGVTAAQNEVSWAQYQMDNADSGRNAAWLAMGGSLLGGLGRGIGQYNDWTKTQTGKKLPFNMFSDDWGN